MQFSSTSYRFIPLRSKYLPQHRVLKHPQSIPPLTYHQTVWINVSIELEMIQKYAWSAFVWND
jgi:hypothetical protein